MLKATIKSSHIQREKSPKTEDKQAAIYIRCSSDEAEKEGYSPETQKETSLKLIGADGNKLNEKCVYKDIGYSGSTDKRPGLQKLLEDARNKEFDIVYVSRMDRFFRNLPLLIKAVNELKSLGIEFKSASEPFDTTTPTGRAMFHMAGTFAEWQREVGLEARNEGMIKAMEEGKYLGGTPPFGYKINKETRKLEINEEEAPIAKMIFKWLVEDKLSEYKIQKKLNAMKIPTKFDNLGREKLTKSKRWWNRRTIGRILRNAIYTGTFWYRKYKHPGRSKSKDNLRQREDWIKVEVPAIISQEMFERAQQQLKKNKKLSSRNTKQLYALQHKIVCGLDSYHYQCATRHYSNKSGHAKTKYYFCPGNRSYFTPESRRCSVPSVSESRILPPVWEKLKGLLTNPEFIMEELSRYRNQKNRKKQIQEKLNNIENALNSYKTKGEKYAELYAEGSIEKPFYDKKIEKCKKEAEGLLKERERLSQLLLTEEEKEKRIQSVKELYHRLKESLENATFEVKREILQRLVEKVVKAGDKLEIEFNLPFLESSLKPAPVVSGDNRRMD